MKLKSFAIYGAGRYGKWLYSQIDNLYKKKPIYFIDNNTQIEADIPVISPLEAKWRREQGEFEEIVIAIINYYTLGDVILELHEIGFEEVVVADPRYYQKEIIGKETEFDKYCYKLNIVKKAILTKLEFHVCDHCNLNCRGCSHFAPIYKESYADIRRFEEDTKRLSELFGNIFRFRLMGGEPFLDDDLDKFIVVVRKYFPYANLEIVTNGLLINKIDNRIFKAIRENEAVLNISLYPPTFAMKDEISNYLDKKEVEYSFGSGLEQYNAEGIIEEFHKNLTLHDDNSPWKAASRCMGSRCHFLRNGRISKCAIPLLAEDVNNAFSTNLCVVEDDYVNIYDDVAPWDAARKLYYSTPFCAYCSENGTERFGWERVGKMKNTLKDYVI